MFYDRYLELCKLKGVKPTNACVEAGLSRGLAAKWKATKTKKPSAEALEKLSAYFNMSIEDVLGLEPKGILEMVAEDNNLVEAASFLRASREQRTKPPADNKKTPLVNEDEELSEYLEMLKNRPEIRMLFQVSKDATKEDVENAVKIIEALRKK